LRFELDFCRLTTTWEEELKLSEACLFMAGIMAGGIVAKRLRAGERGFAEMVLAVGILFD
jgi:hypothetical protein